MAIDFNTLLSTPTDNIEKPKPLPNGTYRGVIFGAPAFREAGANQTPQVEFTVRPTGSDDVDPAELAGINLSEKVLRASFWLSKDAQYRLVDFAKSCGIGVSGRTLSEVISDLCMGTNVIMDVGSVASKRDPETYFNTVNNIRGE